MRIYLKALLVALLTAGTVLEVHNLRRHLMRLEVHNLRINLMRLEVHNLSGHLMHAFFMVEEFTYVRWVRSR